MDFSKSTESIETKPDNSENCKYFSATANTVIKNYHKEIKIAKDEAIKFKKAYAELRELGRPNEEIKRALYAELDHYKPLADLITVGPDRAQEIWQTVLTHIEAKNEALKQKLDTTTSQIEELTDNNKKLEERKNTEKRVTTFTIEHSTEEQEYFRQLDRSLIMCNVLHATRFLNDVEKWREEFIKITAGAADSNGEWRYSEEDHQKNMDKIKEMKEMRKKLISEVSKNVRVLQKPVSRADPNEEGGTLRKLLTKDARKPDIETDLAALKVWDQYLLDHSNKEHARLRAELDEANKLVEQLEQENEELKEVAQETKSKRK